jgi:hypothetical protein
MLCTLTDEVSQFWDSQGQGIDFLTEVDRRHLGALIRFGESDVKTDHSRPILRQHIHQSRDLGPGPRPAPFRIKAFFIDHRHHDRWRSWHIPTREETEVLGFQLNQSEDGGAGQPEHDDEKNGAEGQGRRIDRAQGFKQSHRSRPSRRIGTDRDGTVDMLIYETSRFHHFADAAGVSAP